MGIEETEAAVVQLIFERYAQEKTSLCGLAKYLQEQGMLAPSGNVLWSLATLRGMLTQPAYTGSVFAQRYRYKASRVRRSATHPLGKAHHSSQLNQKTGFLLPLFQL